MSTNTGDATRPTQALLEVRDLHVAYGKAEVVHGISMDVRAGEFVVMLGRNGAGKSTLLHAISGLVPKRAGSIHFEGRDLSSASPRDIVKAGIVQVLEGHRVFHSLSVEDNLLIGTYAVSPHGDRSKLEGIYTLFPELADRRGQMASRLSGGQQQILAVAQGVIGEPKLLILDEPAGGLTGNEIEHLADVIRTLRDAGIGVLLVEHHTDFVFRICDRVTTLNVGKMIKHGTPDEVRADPEVIRVYLGA